MVNIRYPEKFTLSSYDLDVNLFEKFNLKVKDVVPVRSVFLLNTDKGRKVLKKIDYSTKRLTFIEETLDYIRKSYPQVMKFTVTEEKDIYLKWNKDLYCVLDLVDGRECEFSNPIDINIAAHGIAKFHQASYGFLDYCKLVNKEYIIKENCDTKKTITEFKYRLDKLLNLKDRVSKYKYKNEFDIIFLDNVDYYINQIKVSIAILEDSNYYELCKEKDKIVLCHNDLAHHNIIIKDEEAHLIDFDYSIIDLKVRDLCNFINKAIKNFAFDVDRTRNIIYEYQKVNPIDQRELKVLYGLLYFPEDFYSVVKNYYDKLKSWEEEVFIDRLKKKLEFKIDREEFLKDFKRVYISSDIIKKL